MVTLLDPPRNGEGDQLKAGGGVDGLRADPSTTSLRDAVPLPVPGRTEEGFTLIELMVVIVIIGLLAAIVIFNVMPAADKARKTTANVSVQQLDQAFEIYRLDNGRYPTNEEGIQALVTAGYLRRLERDPWGNPFVYRTPGTNGRPYNVISWGADGREGGSGDDADIVN